MYKNNSHTLEGLRALYKRNCYRRDSDITIYMKKNFQELFVHVFKKEVDIFSIYLNILLLLIVIIWWYNQMVEKNQ